jgi:CDP-diacylglycerol--glycerol-3-phosphate 3-phosphatidyltransferase
MSSIRRRLPNAITVGRLALALCFFVLVAGLRPREAGDGDRAWLAVWVFIVAAVSDVLDGFLARRWGVVTGLGRVLDPAVDKILVIGGLVYLASPSLSPESGIAPWMVVLMIGREFLVTSLRAVIEGAGGKFPADWTGKAKMLVQCVAVPMAVGRCAIPSLAASADFCALADGIIWLMVALTAVSLVPAIWRGRAVLRREGASA